MERVGTVRYNILVTYNSKRKDLCLRNNRQIRRMNFLKYSTSLNNMQIIPQENILENNAISQTMPNQGTEVIATTAFYSKVCSSSVNFLNLYT